MTIFFYKHKNNCLCWLCPLLLISCDPHRSLTERKIIGEWSWTYIEGVGRVTFTSDHRVTEGFPPEDKNGRTIPSEEFEIFRSGTWRLERDVLVTEVDNRPLIEISERLTPWDVPPLKTWIDRRRIVKIDETSMVSDDGRVLTRVHR
jgi:hypothetical protein